MLASSVAAVEFASTGPRAFTRIGHSGCVERAERAASTGPRAFTRGSSAPVLGRLDHDRASTGPRAFTRGSARSSTPSAPRTALQRGRALSRADRRGRSVNGRQVTGFNGAARFHARIEAPAFFSLLQLFASTGPRAFTRGSIRRRRRLRSSSALQRGRALSRADRSHAVIPSPSQAQLQRGRALSRADRMW